MQENPTPSDLAAYALILHKIGADQEALGILKCIDPERAPEALLHTARCHLAQWNHTAAIAALEAHPGLEGKAELNLLRAQAMTETAVADKDFFEAERQLRVLELTGPTAFTLRMRAVMKLVTAGDSAPLQQLRLQSLMAHDWDSVRACDFHMLHFAGTQDLFDQLYAGTPIQGFRDALVKMTNKRFTLPSHSVQGDGPRSFDLTTGVIEGRDIFARKKMLHRVLVALCRDTYRPLRVGGLFQAVFPGEAFDVKTSPDRLHQLLFRLRAVLRAAGGPIEVIEEHQYYRAIVQPGWTVTLAAATGAIEPAQISRLRNIFGHEFFTPRAAREHLHITPSALRRLIRSALDANLLVQQGRGPACRYRIAG